MRCGGPHTFEQCKQKDNTKCCRCGENHSSAYAGCSTIKREKKIQNIRVTYNISYADAAKAITTDITIQPDASSQLTPTPQGPAPREPLHQAINKPGPSIEKTERNTPEKIINKPRTPQNPTKKMKSTATQTETIMTQTQTEHIQCSYNANQLTELLIGTIQIWDAVNNKDERITAIKAMVNHIIYAEEAPGSEQTNTQSKQRTHSQSPTRRTRNASNNRRSTKTNTNAAAPGSTSTNLNPNSNQSQPMKGKPNKSS